jgi:hypothetical protein
LVVEIDMIRPRPSLACFVACLAILAGHSGCASPSSRGQSLIYDSESFRAALRERVPDLSEGMRRAPFEISPRILAVARKRVMAEPSGPRRVRALVDFLSDPRPEGLGLQYDWATSSTAERTLELGRGDCVALATVMVGLGRGLGWPIYFAEARTQQPEIREFTEVTLLSDHMVVVVVAKTVRMVIDFLGLVGDGFEIRPIDDLTAYAHLINNVAGHRVIRGKGEGSENGWAAAVDGFRLATRIQPNLGRAWNNLGIAYTRLGRFDEARDAYHRAVELDTVFGSPQRNLTIMETRAAGAPTLTESKLPD